MAFEMTPRSGLVDRLIAAAAVALLLGMGYWLGVQAQTIYQQQAAQGQLLQQIIQRSNEHTDQLRQLGAPPARTAPLVTLPPTP